MLVSCMRREKTLKNEEKRGKTAKKSLRSKVQCDSFSHPSLSRSEAQPRRIPGSHTRFAYGISSMS